MGSCHLSRHISVSHTIMKGGPLWLGFGNLRDKVVDKLKDLRKKYSDFVINSEKNYL